MGKKFMIVKPTHCCQNSFAVGFVFESVNSQGRYPISECGQCGKIWKAKNEIAFMYKGSRKFVKESRIIWLPDESDVIEHDEKLELTA